MKKRVSKRQQNFDFLRFQNYSITSSSPIKTPALLRQDMLSLFKKQKSIIELPKILPIHNSIQHRRYLESCMIYDNNSLNLIGTKFLKKKSQDNKTQQESTIDMSEFKKESFQLQKCENPRQIFIEKILRYNGISSISLSQKDKIKIFIDEGNNSRLINELIRRRSNLKIINNKKEASITWSPFSDWELTNQGSTFTQNQKKVQNQKKQISLFSKTQQSQPKHLKNYRQIVIHTLKMHNHLKNHYQISDKKCLFKNIRKYCKLQKINQNQIIPQTFHIDQNLESLPLQITDNKMWIVKPGQDTNRGTGITVQYGRYNILDAVKELSKSGKSSLVQQYIDPLLYRNRKFDIRCYVLITTICGSLHAYWYKEGYLRTCCKEFNYDPQNIYGHLTNDAVQKKHKDYGKYQQCNKLSFNDLDTFLKTKDISFTETLEKMKKLAYHSIRAAEEKLTSQKNIVAFEIFGYDFLIDSKGKVWLIEINTNPCLQFAGSLLSRVIWHMVQNSFAIAIDPFLQNIPEPYNSARDKLDRIYEDNKYEIII